MSSGVGRRRRSRDIACLAIAMGVCVVLAELAYVFAPAAARQMEIVTARNPPGGGSYYLAHDRGGQIDHHVLYHGTDAVAMERLRAAEVLWLGNSRLMFALDRQTIGRFFADLGRPYYVMGFGHTEQDDFPERIIDRFDLRPSYVIANADGFFWDGHSDWAAKVVGESPFDARKLQGEAEAGHWVRRRLHRLVPQYVDIAWGAPEVVIHRSRLDGSWFVGNRFVDSRPFEWPARDTHEPSVRSIRSAETFKADLEGRGARLILCLVPAPHASIHRARRLAAHLGVPLVTPEVSGMRTVDGSHLSEDSARVFLAALLAELRPLLER